MISGARPSTFARLLRVTSPEMMAGLLSVPVLAVVLAIALASGTGPDGTPPGGVLGSAPPSSAPPSDVLIGASPTPGPSTEPRSSPTPTARPAWAPEARVLLEADTELLAMRDRLSDIAAARPVNTNEIAKQLRVMNQPLTAMLRLVDAMEAKGAPADLVADVRAAYATALDASLEALTASLSSRSAYLAGAADVIASLDVEALMARVESKAGLRPVGSP